MRKVEVALEEWDAPVCRSGHAIDSWLCAAAMAGCDLNQYLPKITDHPRLLLELYERNSVAFSKGKLSNSFWSLAPEEQERKVVDWFTADAVKGAIMKLYGLAD